MQINPGKWTAWSVTILMTALVALAATPLKETYRRAVVACKLRNQPTSWTSPNVAVRIGQSGGPIWVSASQYGKLTAVDKEGRRIIIPSNTKIVEGFDIKSGERYLWGQKDDGTTIPLMFPEW